VLSVIADHYSTLLSCAAILTRQVAPADSHQAAAAALKAVGAHVPRGCLLRRVPADVTHTQLLQPHLQCDTPGVRGARER
jgi:hypothetical protein